MNEKEKREDMKDKILSKLQRWLNTHNYPINHPLRKYIREELLKELKEEATTK